MDALAATAFVFLVGLTLSGFGGTVIELVAGRRLSLRHPFVSAGDISRTIVLVLLAGPFMVMNEALAALEEQRAGIVLFAATLSFCCLWLLADGLFLLGLVENARDTIGCPRPT